MLQEQARCSREEEGSDGHGATGFWVATGKISTKISTDFPGAGIVICPHVPPRIQHLEPLWSCRIPAGGRHLQNQLFRQQLSWLRAHLYCSSVCSNPLQSLGRTATDFAAEILDQSMQQKKRGKAALKSQRLCAYACTLPCAANRLPSHPSLLRSSGSSILSSPLSSTSAARKTPPAAGWRLLSAPSVIPAGTASRGSPAAPANPRGQAAPKQPLCWQMLLPVSYNAPLGKAEPSPGSLSQIHTCTIQTHQLICHALIH